MRYRFEKLCQFAVEHAFYAETGEEFIAWAPTAECTVTLARHRLLWRTVRNGGVVLFEVDSARPGLEPLIPVPTDLRLTFAGRVIHAGVTATTEPLTDTRRPYVLSNAGGSLDGATRLLHGAAQVTAANQARLVRTLTRLRYATENAEPLLEITDADGGVVRTLRPVVTDGFAEAVVDLAEFTPSLLEVRLDGVVQERLYVDEALAAETPVIVLTLVAQPGIAGLEFLDAAGKPLRGGAAFTIRLAARTAIWRIIVVPRDDPHLDENTLAVEDTVLIGPAPRFEFNSTGPKALLPSGVPAVIFESATLISLRARPYRGVTLKTRRDPGDPFVTAISDLPNPLPFALSVASTPARPVSEVFVYV
jgi:hypothetical protein